MDKDIQMVRQAIVATTGLDSEVIRPESRLHEDLGMDRITKLEVISALAEGLQVDVALGEANKIKTVQGLIDLVRRSTSKGQK